MRAKNGSLSGAWSYKKKKKEHVWKCQMMLMFKIKQMLQLVHMRPGIRASLSFLLLLLHIPFFQSKIQNLSKPFWTSKHTVFITYNLFLNGLGLQFPEFLLRAAHSHALNNFGKCFPGIRGKYRVEKDTIVILRNGRIPHIKVVLNL